MKYFLRLSCAKILYFLIYNNKYLKNWPIFYTPYLIDKVMFILFNRAKSMHNGGNPDLFKNWLRHSHIRKNYRQILYPDDKDAHLSAYIWNMYIGHTAQMAAVIRLHQMGGMPFEKIKFYADDKYMPNEFFFNKLRPYLDIIHKEKWQKYEGELRIKSLSKYIIPTNLGDIHDWYIHHLSDEIWREKNGGKAFLHLTDDEKNNGYSKLKSIGLNPDKWFVALHIRNGVFKNDHHSLRNADIHSYGGMARKITDAGGQVVFLGHSLKDSNTPPPNWFKEHVINYADSTIRSPELDIFLCAESRFFVGCISGMSHVIHLFNTPLLAVNIAPIYSRPLCENEIWIPKKFKCKKTNKYLNFDEISKTKYFTMEDGTHFDTNEMEIEDNTDEELSAGAEDMLLYLQGELKIDESRAITRHFDKIDYLNNLNFSFKSILAPSFIRLNKDKINFIKDN